MNFYRHVLQKLERGFRRTSESDYETIEKRDVDFALRVELGGNLMSEFLARLTRL